MVRHNDQSLAILLQQQASIREDSRHHWALIVALFTVGIAVLGAVIVLTGQPVCSGHDSSHRTTSEPLLGQGSVCVPSAIWALVPLVPLTLTALLEQQVALHQVRSVYERSVERALITEFGTTVQVGPDTGRVNRLPIPAISHLEYRIFYPNTFLRMPFFALSVLVFATLLGLDLAILFLAFHQAAGHAWRTSVAVLYCIPTILLLFGGLYPALWANHLWRQGVTILRSDLQGPVPGS